MSALTARHLRVGGQNAIALAARRGGPNGAMRWKHDGGRLLGQAGTVEESIKALQQRKAGLDASVLDARGAGEADEADAEADEVELAGGAPLDAQSMQMILEHAMRLAGTS
jgi:hypothetical protein